MKKIYAYFLILFLLISAITYKIKNKEVIPYKLQGKTYRLFVADSESEWTKGLMDVKKLENVQGMIFLFPDKQKRTFWNKNTFINLDVYWVDDDKVLGKDFLPSIDKSKDFVYISSPFPVNKVVELVHK